MVKVINGDDDDGDGEADGNENDCGKGEADVDGGANGDDDSHVINQDNSETYTYEADKYTIKVFHATLQLTD